MVSAGELDLGALTAFTQYAMQIMFSMLMMVMMFIDQGRILVDGMDVREMSQESLRSKIGFVPQKAMLFSGSIRENISFGNPQAAEGEIRHAAEVAQAAEFIAALPDKYEHQIAQGGLNVSGGQKQRLVSCRTAIWPG